MSKRPLPVFVAFEGGGAKGLLHVGALRALEKRGITARGYAGTSAGSIVAALAAAGFRADEIVSVDAKRSLIDDMTAIDSSITTGRGLFGPGGWRRVQKLTFFLRNGGKIAVTMLALIVLSATGVGWSVATGSWFILLFMALLAGLASVTTYAGSRVWNGLNKVDTVKRLFSSLLQAKMFPDEPHRVVLMRDMGVGGRPSLKIVSADIDSRDIRLFSPENTPDIPVADAVAASSCLPVIFSPHLVNGKRHVDGGIVSNLPAWPFDEERELASEALTIALKIVDAMPEKASNWVLAFVMTALFGAGRLSLRAAGHVELIQLPTEVKTLDFNMSLKDACRVVLEAETVTGAALDERLLETPQDYRTACGLVRSIADESITTILGITEHRVRAAIALQNPEYHHSLRLRYGSGFEADRDARMLIPINGTAAGEAWKTGKTVFAIAPFSPHHLMEGDDHTERRKNLWPDRKWIMAVPVSTELGDGSLVVQIDGDADFSQDREAARDILSELEHAVQDFFDSIEKSRMEREISDA